MKKIWKRVLALLCAATLIVSGYAIKQARIVKAEKGQCNYTVFSKAEGMNIASGITINDAKVVLPDTVKKGNLALSIKIKVNNSADITTIKDNARIELAQTKADENEIQWRGLNLTAGKTNEILLPFSEHQMYTGYLDLTKTLQWFRIYYSGAAPQGEVLLYEVKVVDTSEAGMKFGKTDTYLQLESALAKTPETIEASVKTDKEVSEWTVFKASNTNITQLYSEAGIVTTNGTTEGTEAPGTGVKYAQFDVPIKIKDSTQGRLAFWEKFQVSVPNKYTKNDLVLSFWIHSSSAGKMANGDLELSSNSGYGSKRLFWNIGSKIGTLNAGWNYIELPLSEGAEESGFTITDIKHMRWNTYGSAELSTAKTYKFTDMKLKVAQAQEVNEWTVFSAENPEVTYIYDAITSKIVTSSGTTTEGEAPGTGVAYTQYAVPIKVSGSNEGRLSFWKKLNIAVPSTYTKNDLVLAFWIYSSSAGKMPNGELELSSANGYGSKRLYWGIHSKIGTLNQGWNYVELPLSTGTTEDGFTIESIKNMRWNTYGSAELNTATTYKFTDMKLKVVAGNTPTSNTVTKTENVDAKTLASNQMIFSNTNVQAETTAYALFVTSEGYPALLWGTNQYTLDYSVRTGEWVDIAVSRDAEGYINFYINGVLKGKSGEKETSTLGAFTTAHCIGADEVGGQLFDGRIADVRVWEDTRTQKEISDNRIAKQDLKEMALQENGLSAETEGLLGSWYLYGDIQYVLENKADISKYDNTAVFRGTRATDWVDYQMPTDIGDDYWTLAFVPDIQNLTESGNGKYDYTETWKAIGQWIADNAENEKIQHVVSAGDVTWSNNDTQYGKAMEGFEKFMNRVSWSSIIGNHDYVWNATDRDSAKYQQYFGESIIMGSASSATYSGYFEDPAGKTTTENSYYRFSVNGKNWMIMQLELHPRTSVLDWAKEIMTKHCNDNVILTTHSYIDGYGNYTQNKNMNYINEGTDNASGGYMGDSSGNIWTKLQDCTNIKMILCGHAGNGTGAVVERMETNANGDLVPALMLNAQDLDAGEGKREEPSYYTGQPLGMLGLLRFSNDGSKVALQWYSPTAEKSFSPLWKGERNSNSLIYTINAKACTHKDATGGSLTTLINEDKATATTNGYTGDSYCEECQQIVSWGNFIEKLGGSEENSSTTENNNSNNTNTTEKSPITGDFAKPIVWIVMLLGAIITGTVLMVRNVFRYRKERE